MGSVYEARHIELDNRVALKLIGPLDIDGPTLPARVLREARAAAQLEHDHVVRVFDVGADGGFSFLVMELLNGDDLARVLQMRGSLTVEEVVDALLPVASAIATAHDSGILHRDLKPANVVLARGASGLLRPVVTDFGICKILSDEEYDGLTQSAALLGSIPYLSPEQTRGAKYASPAGDQYALGIMLYECVVGQRPFQGASGYEVMHAIVNATVSHPSDVKPSVPRDFGDLILKAIHRNPQNRFPSVRDLGLALLPFAGRRTATLWEVGFASQRVITCVDPCQEDDGADLIPLSRAKGRSLAVPQALTVTGRKARSVAFIALSALAGAGLSQMITATRSPMQVTTSPQAGGSGGEPDSQACPPSSVEPWAVPVYSTAVAELPSASAHSVIHGEGPNPNAENSARPSSSGARAQRERRPKATERQENQRRPISSHGSGGTTPDLPRIEPELGSNHTVILE